MEYVKLHRDGDTIAHVFHYPAPSNLAGAVVQEGQRLEFLNLTDLQLRQAVPRHRNILEWYEAQKSDPESSQLG